YGSGALNPLGSGSGGTASVILPDMVRGSYSFSAKALNNAGSYSLPPDGTISFTVVQRPTAVISAPPTGALFTTGAKVALTATLTAEASSFFGMSGLTFQWTADAGDPAPVTFDFKGVNPTVNAAFTKAGTYHFTATIADPLSAFVKTSTTVVVTSGLQISPSP